MNIYIIFAVSQNGTIGDKNRLQWHLPKDMAYFKGVTTGHIVIMGRKNWDSIPEKFRPLSDRFNIVITRNEDLLKNMHCFTNLIFLSSPEEALKKAEESGKDIFVIGGAEIYNKFLSMGVISGMHITRVHTEIDGDVKFIIPEETMKEFELVVRNDFNSDERNKYNFSFEVWARSE